MYFLHTVNVYNDNLEFIRSYNFTSKQKAIDFANSVRTRFGKITLESNYV